MHSFADMKINFSDIYRATLPFHSGNEGWIGLEPHGLDYHVVVPVDAQIARGVMACNLPTDGTPFGGYTGWLYFRCETYSCEEVDQEEGCRLAAAIENSEKLVDFAGSHQIKLVIEQGEATGKGPGISGTSLILSQGEKVPHSGTAASPSPLGNASRSVRCAGCPTTWDTVATFLRDPGVRICGYRAEISDFPRGAYVFVHTCGSHVEIPVRWLGRSRFLGKSLAGSHACPGLCYYDECLSDCNAECEGSLYRRLAGRLRSRI